MNTTNELSTKPRSTRYTKDTMEHFAELEKQGINVSYYIRQAVDEKKAREKQKSSN